MIAALEWSEVPTDICREECFRPKPECSYRRSGVSRRRSSISSGNRRNSISKSSSSSGNRSSGVASGQSWVCRELMVVSNLAERSLVSSHQMTPGHRKRVS